MFLISSLKEAKILRFKEVGLWRYDEKRYFTNESQKYLMYDNSKDFGYQLTPDKERSSLITAMTLGKILNRIVILPTFHCYGCDDIRACKRINNDCAFNALFHVKSFDSHFSGQYREHTFLNHVKVPETIKNSISPKIHIVTKGKKKVDGLATGDKIRIETKNKKKISTHDVISLFGEGPISEFSVLNFHSLYIYIHFNDHSWLNIFDDALKFYNYRQDPRVKDNLEA